MNRVGKTHFPKIFQKFRMRSRNRQLTCFLRYFRYLSTSRYLKRCVGSLVEVESFLNLIPGWLTAISLLL